MRCFNAVGVVYYLTSERNRYRFSLVADLNSCWPTAAPCVQAAADRRAPRAEVQKVFAQGSGVERNLFPEKSNQIRSACPDVRVLAPDGRWRRKEDPHVRGGRDARTRPVGPNVQKRAWFGACRKAPGRCATRPQLLAWDDIQAEEDQLRLDDSQKRQLTESVKKAQRDLKECVWRTYKHLVLLGKDNALQRKDSWPGSTPAPPTTWWATTSTDCGANGDVEPGVSPTFLARHWPAQTEWSTKAVRDAFFASPLFPRLLDGDSVKETIARGVGNGVLAYVGKGKGGRYNPFHFGVSLDAAESKSPTRCSSSPGRKPRSTSNRRA